MIVPDVNLLLYAHIEGYPHHARARAWWEDLLSGDTDVALAGPVVFGFIRIATNPRVFDPPMTVEFALGVVDGWLQRPNVRFLVPGPHHLDIAFRLLRECGTGSNLTTDAQIAAHAVEEQGDIHSADTDFARFRGVRWHNPLD